ncbi:hypothetical protein C481_01572 [Natrialba asiatica DSM 12278]|uniref:Uncharacterized protein n=1 Tax=Natrialba asiatica (strain ATCC 700177 / DSM 12278 / JCM 9576 / FERM P-10747 / NBRC 102637 / 172P1) TaxID=29540 RepID=M0B590_NATA1|nr:hypothetical protein C481_01572 [Natrialba asiatica DSM 12278]
MCCLAAIDLAAGSVNETVAPFPGSESIQILPPWRSTSRSQSASPIPVPSYSSRLWSRSKTGNTLSWFSGSIPIPSSSTDTTYLWPRRVDMYSW